MEGLKLFLPIGIDKYTKDPWPVLTNAKEDVERLGKILCEKYGFIILDDFVIDEKATLDLIHDEFEKAVKRCYDVDELIIYFAGHGEESPSGTGHWIPVDGDDKRRHWISNASVIDHINEIKAKHVFLISDSCYSGTFVLKQLKLSGINLKVEEITEKRSRIILTSGDVTKVSDGVAGSGSPFNKTLCEVLQNNTRPALRLSKLIDSVVRTTSVRSKQIPQACELDCQDNDGGDMTLCLVDKEVEAGIVKTNFPLPPLNDIEKLIPRTYTSNENKDSIANLLFDLKHGKINLNRILEQEKQIVILGSAGSGKSIETLRQAYDFQRTRTLNPIFKRLNDYVGGSIKNFLDLDLAETDSSRMVVFLDGLDEIPSDFFQDATEQILALSKEEPLLSLVVTCRTNFYEIPNENSQGKLPGFVCYHINDIGLDEILLFCENVLKIDGEDFLKQARQNLFTDLLTRPFFLNILLEHYIEHGNLAVSRIDILEHEISKTLTFTEAISKDSKQQQKEKVFLYLEKISFTMEMIGKNFLIEQELHEIFPDQSDFELCNKLSIFSLNSDNGHWSFNHNNQQEYFAARVLAKLPLDKLLSTTTSNFGGKVNLRPSWINTISFYVSIAPQDRVNELLNWLVENDAEVIVKFEPERLTEELKAKVFRNIFDYYSDQGIWLNSNKFSDEEISRFAHSAGGIEHLLGKLSDPNSSKITVYNALHVLINFDIGKLPGYEGKIREILMERIEYIDKDDASLVHSLIGVLGHLKLAEETILGHLLDKFKKSKNQYLRSAIYQLLYYSGTSGEHLEILFDGLDLERMAGGDNDREDINLGDESFNLRHAIESIKDPHQLQAFLERLLGDDYKRWKLTHDHREVYPKLVQNAIEGFSKNGQLFDVMIRLLLTLQTDHNKHILDDVSRFFIETGTKSDLLLYLWTKTDRKEYGWTDLIISILDQETVEMMVGFYQSKDLNKDDLHDFHEILYRNDLAYPVLLELFESLLKEKTSIELSRPEPSKWPEIERQRNKDNFSKLFSKDRIIEDVKRAFEHVGSETIKKDQVIGLWTNGYNNENWISYVAINVIRENINFSGSTTEQQVIDWVSDSPEFLHFQIKHIHRYLQQDNQLSLNGEQVEFVQQWCAEVADDVNLLWYFFTVNKVPLGDEKLLELTKFVNHSRDTKVAASGSIEIIAHNIAQDKLIKQIHLNLNDPNLSLASWSSNAAYALRAEIKEAYPFISDKFKTTAREFVNDEELLEFWFEKTKNKEAMRDIILNTQSIQLKWNGVKLLLSDAEEHIFLKETLNKFLLKDDEQMFEKQEAANFLIELKDISGFHYLADYILEKKDPKIETRFGYRNLDILTSPEAIEKLYSLLYLAKQPEFKQDIFNDLETRVLTAFVNIGVQSEENGNLAIQALKGFIQQYQGGLPNLNFLHYQIVRIQEQLKLNADVGLNIKDAVNIYESL